MVENKGWTTKEWAEEWVEEWATKKWAEEWAKEAKELKPTLPMTFSNRNDTVTATPLEDMKKLMAELDEMDKVTVERSGQVEMRRLSKMIWILPCNDRRELVGLDAEVIYFHAYRANIPTERTVHIEAGQ